MDALSAETDPLWDSTTSLPHASIATYVASVTDVMALRVAGWVPRCNPQGVFPLVSTVISPASDTDDRKSPTSGAIAGCDVTSAWSRRRRR